MKPIKSTNPYSLWNRVCAKLQTILTPEELQIYGCSAICAIALVTMSTMWAKNPTDVSLGVTIAVLAFITGMTFNETMNDYLSKK